MYGFSNREKAMLHLSLHMGLDPNMEFGAPLEITQDGVAMALGITRSHASTILNRMKNNGEVMVGLSRVDGGDCKVKRKIYFLTPKGKAALDERLSGLLAAGVPPSELEFEGKIDRYSDAKMASMEIRQRNGVGMLMVMRTPVHRRDVDPELLNAVSFDASGWIRFKSATRKRFMGMATEDDIRTWHSMAADHHGDNDGDLCEIIHHMTLARRIREAERIVGNHRFEMCDMPDEDTLESILGLCEVSIDVTVRDTAILMAIRLGDTGPAWRLLGRDRRTAMHPETLLAEGRLDEAMESALDNYDGTMENALVLGKCMVMAGRDEEALTFLGKARAEMMKSRCLFRLDEVLLYEAVAEHDLGNIERASSLARAGRAASRSPVVMRILEENCPDAFFRERCSS